MADFAVLRIQVAAQYSINAEISGQILIGFIKKTCMQDADSNIVKI